MAPTKFIYISNICVCVCVKIQEAQRAPNKVNPNKPTPRHTVIKMAKVKEKERILKAAREKAKF